MDTLKVLNHADQLNDSQRRFRVIAHSWHHDLNPDRKWRFYAECHFCKRDNSLRESPDVRTPVDHKPECDYPKILEFLGKTA